MLELKSYQRQCVEDLRDFLRDARKEGDPNIAFYKRTGKAYNVLHGDPQAPFVCIRVPTGGGKTLIAAHAVGTAFEHFLLEKEERGLVLWMVPSDAIRTQTLAQLRDRNHPYREALDAFFDGRVRVLDIVEARSVKPSDIADNLCIIVTTLASVRRRDKEGLKVYEENGGLMEHFRDIDEEGLMTDEEGLATKSLANVIRMHRPLMILDEGHNAQTELSVEVIREFLPSCIVEFTATPIQGSNVLVSIPAIALKKADMVKIPIHLTNITQWQEAVQTAKEKRDELEQIAEQERRTAKDYIRPILLLQAEREQAKEGTIHVHALVSFLVEELGVQREAIAIKTGKEDELAQYPNLQAEDCPVRYIVTCNALKEGWDCSFAYVLVSVSNLGTRLGVEQLIGRILRLPQAKRKTQDALNRSYVYTSSRRFDDAAQLVVNGLQQEGYDQGDVIRSDDREQRTEYEAMRNVSTEEYTLPLLALDGEPLDFYDLIPPDFTLREQQGAIALLENVENRTSLIDVEEDAVVASAQQRLGLLHLSQDETESMLVRWLVGSVRERAVSREDMAAFIAATVHDLLQQQSLSVLYSRKFALRDALALLIRQLLTEEAARQFAACRDAGRITASRDPWIVPQTLTLLHPMREPFTKHLFDRCDELNCADPNDSEMALARQLDQHANVEWWLRNVVQDRDGFRLQGYKREGFFPDFIVCLRDGTTRVLEYKGADRASNEDTAYKVQLGEVWAEVCGEGYGFAVVTQENIAKILSTID